MTKLILGFLHSPNEHGVESSFEIRQKDTTEPKCHKTESLDLFMVRKAPGKPNVETHLFSFHSWMSSAKLGDRYKLDHAYYSGNDEKVLILDAIARGIHDSFDESAPDERHQAVIDQLEKTINMIKEL